jgi:hypothetical protein
MRLSHFCLSSFADGLREKSKPSFRIKLQKDSSKERVPLGPLPIFKIMKGGKPGPAPSRGHAQIHKSLIPIGIHKVPNIN